MRVVFFLVLLGLALAKKDKKDKDAEADTDLEIDADEQEVGEYKEWKNKNGKGEDKGKKVRPEVENRRKKNFVKNLRAMKKHNADKSKKWTMKMGPFADLTEEEVKAIHTGLVAPPVLDLPSNDSHRRGPPTDREESSISKRSTYILGRRDKEQSDQAPNSLFVLEGPVTGFEASTAITPAQASAIEQLNMYEGSSSGYLPFSPQELVDCDYSASGCNGGWLASPINYAASHGLSADSDYSYYAAQGSCQRSSYSHASPVASDYNLLSTESEIEATLRKNYACTAAVNTAGGFDNYESGVFYNGINPSTYDDVGHAVLLVGYGPDYWLLQNSWGSRFGDNGFIKVAKNGGGFWTNHVYCPTLSGADRDESGPSGGCTCHFPFTYDGETYNGCTEVGNDQPWCYTDSSQSSWVNCDSSCPNDGGCMVVGLVGTTCHFPFVYRDVTYNGCTDIDEPDYWCYTNSDFSEWNFCNSDCPTSSGDGSALPTVSPSNGCPTIDFSSECQFPFVYGGTTYHTCTEVDDYAQWCGTDVNSDGSYNDWDYCSALCPWEW